jgi:diguanylate cyclase (GGDEF)-like protein/PAS domain S-box-containing protein
MTLEESLKKIESLERRLKREKLSRLAAESILEEKSKEVYLTNQNLTIAITELGKLSVAVEQSPIVVMIMDINGIVEYVNHSFTEMTGYSKQQAIGQDVRSLEIIVDDPPDDGVRYVFRHKKLWKGEMTGASQDELPYKLKTSISPILNEQGCVTHFQFNCEDITVQKENEARIYDLAHRDSLTDLYNRLSINAILDESINAAIKTESIMSVMFIDMDRFKQINDTHGHRSGDVVLQEVAFRLRKIFRRKTDYIARIGGDEFLIVLSDVKDIFFITSTANALVEKLSKPYFNGSQELSSSPSIGISLYPNDGQTPEELIKNADAAMYHAKESGRSQYCFFSTRLHRLVEDKNAIELALRRALKSNEFDLYFQPQIYLGEQKVFAFEALIRCRNDTLASVPPSSFIAIAEKRGLIYPIGLWVIERAFQQLSDWANVTEVPIKIAINLSAKQIEDVRFLADLGMLINKYAIEPCMIEFEITETVAMANPELSVTILGKIRDLGFTLAIDDFGTGYSSLAYLKNLPVQTIKIDKSLVKNLDVDINNAKICRAAISLSHELGFRVVAEGVESKGEAKFLAGINCDILQGFYYCHPLPADEALSFIQNYQIHEV